MSSDSDFSRLALDEFLPQVRLPPAEQGPSKSANRPWTVILTGSTGSLGTYILSTLHRCPPEKLGRVYCLNRSENARDKQSADLLSRDLPHSALHDERFIYLQADLGSRMLGLGHDKFHQLLSESTVIIHNAWTVNFLLPGDAFRPNLEGLRNLLQFAHQSPNQPPVLFVSSLGIAYSSDQQHIEETIFHDLNLCDGYSQSKYVAEQMLEAYTLSTGLPAAVMRVGQISGPVRNGGVWPAREWFPTLLRASRHIGVLPNTLGQHNHVDWIPVDIISQILVEIAEFVVAGGYCPNGQGRDSTMCRTPMVFNIANPRTVSFETLLPHFVGRVVDNVVPGDEWAWRLEYSVNRGPGVPGAKLLEFYKRIFTISRPVLETATQNLTAASRTAREMPPVNAEWVLRWLDQWGYRSYTVASRL